MSQSKYPPGWDERRVQRVLDHYESQTELEAVAEDEAAVGVSSSAIMEIPTDLIPVVRELLAKHAASQGQ